MTKAIDTEAEVRIGLLALAPRLVGEATDLVRLERLSGGATQEIWRFDLVGRDGQQSLILRRAPQSLVPSSDGFCMSTEARLLKAASVVGVAVPEVLHVLDKADRLGDGFIMRFVEGETLGGRIVRLDALADARKTLASECGEALARIHAIDTAPFPELPRFHPIEAVEHWFGIYQSGGVARPVFDLAFRWLRENLSASSTKMCLVHGDFRNGNLMIGPEGIRAVLDWELAHVGDPMEDLGWLCVNSWRFGKIDLPVGGFGSYDDLFEGYERAGGIAIDRRDALWWEVFGTLKWGIMCANALSIFRQSDPTVERALIARRASETEIDLLRLIGR